MRKIISTVTVLLLLFSLTSCKEKNREYDEAEVKAAALDLIEGSAVLNEVLWGRGIEYDVDTNYSNGYYYPASPMALEELGISSVDDLKAKCAMVFSTGYCESIFGSVFSSYGDKEDILGYARYYQGLDALMVYSRANVLLSDEVEYLYDTLSVTHSRGEVVYVSISVKVTRGEKSQTQTIEVGLIEEASGFRIDTPTYLVYNEYLDEN